MAEIRRLKQDDFLKTINDFLRSMSQVEDENVKVLNTSEIKQKIQEVIIHSEIVLDSLTQEIQ